MVIAHGFVLWRMSKSIQQSASGQIENPKMVQPDEANDNRLTVNSLTRCQFHHHWLKEMIAIP